MKFRRTVEIEKGKRLEITPLIDVVLLLLIFFMLTSSFVFNPGIKVDLPEHSSKEDRQNTDIEVIITRSYEVYFEGEYVSPIDQFKKLRLKFNEAVRENKDRRIMIKADVSVPFGRVVRIMSLAAEEGLHNQAIATKQGEETE